MQLLTIDEIISSIMKETDGLDAEITDGIILSKKEIPPSEIEKLKSELEIVPIASDFKEFIRVMGTAQYAVWNHTEEEFVELMEREASDSSLAFWKELVSVY